MKREKVPNTLLVWECPVCHEGHVDQLRKIVDGEDLEKELDWKPLQEREVQCDNCESMETIKNLIRQDKRE